MYLNSIEELKGVIKSLKYSMHCNLAQQQSSFCVFCEITWGKKAFQWDVR